MEYKRAIEQGTRVNINRLLRDVHRVRHSFSVLQICSELPCTWPRASDLEKYESATTTCTMNCGPLLLYLRRKERLFLPFYMRRDTASYCSYVSTAAMSVL